MRRPVEWVDRAVDGARVTVRVTFRGTRSLRWQMRRADEAQWRYDVTATPEQWATLVATVEARYRRRAASWEDVLRVRRWRDQALAMLPSVSPRADRIDLSVPVEETASMGFDDVARDAEIQDSSGASDGG